MSSSTIDVSLVLPSLLSSSSSSSFLPVTNPLNISYKEEMSKEKGTCIYCTFSLEIDDNVLFCLNTIGTLLEFSLEIGGREAALSG